MPRKPDKVPEHVLLALKEQVVHGHVKEPDLQKLVAHFIDICGGERAMATLLYGEFAHANQGSLVRQRIMDMVMRGLSKLSERQTQHDDLGVLSLEDLQKELLYLVDGLSDAEAPGQHPGPQAAPARVGGAACPGGARSGPADRADA